MQPNVSVESLVKQKEEHAGVTMSQPNGTMSQHNVATGKQKARAAS